MNRRQAGGGITLIVAIAMAVFAAFQYFGSSQVNPTTGEKQHVTLTSQQEVALGVNAAPEMEQQFGGLSEDANARALVDTVGQRVVSHSDAAKSPYKYDFHLLADAKTVNAFALPGGQIFVTEGLLKKLRTEGELAGVLGHEIGHVIGRHGAEQLAKQKLTQGLVGAAGVAGSGSNDPYAGQRTAQLAAAVGQMVNMKYGRNDELEADKFGVKLMSEAGYDPRAMLGVMQVLGSLSKSGRTPEFFSTHPNPENRSGRIKKAIADLYRNGVPDGLKR
jgi:predicted Zn-dependent protease